MNATQLGSDAREDEIFQHQLKDKMKEFKEKVEEAIASILRPKSRALMKNFGNDVPWKIKLPGTSCVLWLLHVWSWSLADKRPNESRDALLRS